MKIGAMTGCHQMCERSFSAGKYQFPVCARCTGLFAGQALCLIFFNIALHADFAFLLITAAVSVVILGADGLLQLTGRIESTNRRRFFTGLFCGFFTSGVFLRLAASALASAILSAAI